MDHFYTCDELGRLKSSKGPDGLQFNFEYSNGGNLRRVFDANGRDLVRNDAYDAAGERARAVVREAIRGDPAVGRA